MAAFLGGHEILFQGALNLFQVHSPTPGWLTLPGASSETSLKLVLFQFLFFLKLKEFDMSISKGREIWSSRDANQMEKGKGFQKSGAIAKYQGRGGNWEWLIAGG